MNLINKIIVGAVGLAILGVGANFLINRYITTDQVSDSGPDAIVKEFDDLRKEAEGVKLSAGSECANVKDINKKLAT